MYHIVSCMYHEYKVLKRSHNITILQYQWILQTPNLLRYWISKWFNVSWKNCQYSESNPLLWAISESKYRKIVTDIGAHVIGHFDRRILYFCLKNNIDIETWPIRILTPRFTKTLKPKLKILKNLKKRFLFLLWFLTKSTYPVNFFLLDRNKSRKVISYYVKIKFRTLAFPRICTTFCYL